MNQIKVLFLLEALIMNRFNRTLKFIIINWKVIKPFQYTSKTMDMTIMDLEEKQLLLIQGILKLVYHLIWLTVYLIK